MTYTAIMLAIALSVTPGSVNAQTEIEQSNAKQKSVAQETTYCIQYDDLVGSRIRKSECLTKKQWAKQGVDVDEVLKGGSR